MNWTAAYAVVVTVVLVVVTAWALLMILRERRHNRSRRMRRLQERDRHIAELERELFGWHDETAPPLEREPVGEVRALAVAWKPEEDRQVAERTGERARHLDENLPDPSRDIRELAAEVRELATSWKQPQRRLALVEDARDIRDLVYRMSHSTTRLRRCAQQLIAHAEHGAHALTAEELTHLRQEMQTLETMVRDTDHALFVLSVFLQDHGAED